MMETDICIFTDIYLQLLPDLFMFCTILCECCFEVFLSSVRSNFPDELRF